VTCLQKPGAIVHGWPLRPRADGKFTAQEILRIGRGVTTGMFAVAKIPHIAG